MRGKVAVRRNSPPFILSLQPGWPGTQTTPVNMSVTRHTGLALVVCLPACLPSNSSTWHNSDAAISRIRDQLLQLGGVVRGTGSVGAAVGSQLRMAVSLDWERAAVGDVPVTRAHKQLWGRTDPSLARVGGVPVNTSNCGDGPMC